MTNEQDGFWYNIKTKQVEEGPQSVASERIGPFPTREDAERGPEILDENARKWAEEEAREAEENE